MNKYADLFGPDNAVGRMYLKLVALYVAIGALLRAVLMSHPVTALAGMSLWRYVSIFLSGAVNDACVVTVLLLPLCLFVLSIGSWRFGRPRGYVFLGLLVCLLVYMLAGAGWLAEFNRQLYRGLVIVVCVWIAVYALRLLAPRARPWWTRVWMSVILGVYVFVMVGNALSEWVFWDEFGVRYNFIAVDYLVYTSEVIGNIVESYPIGWMVSGVALVSVALEWLLLRHEIALSATMARERGWRVPTACAYALLSGVSLAVLPAMHRLQDTADRYYNELQASGPYSFYLAFLANDLDYDHFYITNSRQVVDADIQALLGDRVAVDSLQRDCNIVVITLESMSADYMRAYGDTLGLTPTLDSLYTRSLAFDNMFAAGNRTVRGLEALTLSRPPSPGESVIKRPEHRRYPSVVDSLAGYRTMFVYGGDAYFDNMEAFYTSLGYDIVDSKTLADDDVTFRTIWGVCDEDVYDMLVRRMDSCHDDGVRVYAHLMSTSNHRPFTYPEGRVSISPALKSRNGAVMYSDYALGRFLDMASRRPWFDNTVFVIVADHCASSAGRVELPLPGYHIPCMVYAPAIIEPRVVSRVSSQIDILPTVLALLGQPVPEGLYGRDILSDGYVPRAFLATYQDMGYLEGDTLTILSPGQRVRQLVVSPTADEPYRLTAIQADTCGVVLRHAVSLYQSAQ